MRSHNIVGCEAIDDPYYRLRHFSHAHGSIRMLPRRGRSRAVRLAAAFLAGAVSALALVVLLIA